MKSVYIELNYTWGEAGGRQVYIIAKQLKIFRNFLFIKSFANLSQEISFLTMPSHHSKLQNPVLSYGFHLFKPVFFPPFSISSNFIVLRLTFYFTLFYFTLSFQITSSESQGLVQNGFVKTFYIIKKIISHLRIPTQVRQYIFTLLRLFI